MTGRDLIMAQFRVRPTLSHPWATASVRGRDGPVVVRVVSAGPVWWSVLYGSPRRLQPAVWRSEDVDVQTLRLLGVGIRVEIGDACHELPADGSHGWASRAMRWVTRAHKVGGRVDGLAPAV